MPTLIVPACGQSIRYGGGRPKFLWCHPFGVSMFTASLEGVMPQYDNDVVYGVFLQAHLDEYKFRLDELEDDGWKLETIIIEDSLSQIDTVVQAIEKAEITGPIIIKDCDNQFDIDLRPGNYVATYSLKKMGKVNAANKSYVSVDSRDFITSIVEKEVISDTFCCGLYSFESAERFVEMAKELGDYGQYISDIVWAMILNKEFFKSVPVERYVDWGTVEDWHEYRKGYNTYFVDIDGTLITNGGPHSEPFITEGSALPNNIKTINELHDGYHQIVLTTARAHKYEEATRKELKRLGIKYHYLLCGLNHGKRILINDFAASNPYPSCEAICIPRDCDELRKYL